MLIEHRGSARPFTFAATVVLVLLSVLAGCSDESELKWTEDVKLPDGRVIAVSRRSEFKAPHEIGQTPGESHMWMEFDHPVTKERVRFESVLQGTTTELEAARAKPSIDPALLHYPYALMLKENDIYVVAKLYNTIYRFYGCPDPPFLLYRWRQAHWERRPLEEIPYRRFAPNLTIEPKRLRKEIEASGFHLKAGQIVFAEVGYGAVEFDISGMNRQTFDLPPNCTSCTEHGSYGPRADSPVTAPICLREQRAWTSRAHLTN